MIQLRVLAVSTNHNAFGVRNMILIGDNGKGWQAAANDLNVKKTGDVIVVPDTGNVTEHLARMQFEIPSELSCVTEVLFRKVWPE